MSLSVYQQGITANQVTVAAALLSVMAGADASSHSDPSHIGERSRSFRIAKGESIMDDVQNMDAGQDDTGARIGSEMSVSTGIVRCITYMNGENHDFFWL